MILDTIDASYSPVYPPRAVQFFKDYHSREKIVGRSESGEVLVAIEDGRILATGSLIGSEIVGVFVHPDHQRQGRGETMMVELESRARAEGLSEITLSISLPSRQFYEHLGYTVLGEHSLDVGKGQYLHYWQGKKKLVPPPCNMAAF
jgi:GNAT superfamily N-acetyltransferase